VLRKMFGPKKDKVSAQCGILHIEKLRDLSELSNIAGIVTSKRLLLVRHVERMGR
jgi:hypothetical protein